MEKVTVFSSFFSIVAWKDFMMSWVCSMLMFQEAWIRKGQGKAGGGLMKTGHSSTPIRGQGLQRPLSPDWLLWDQRRDAIGQMKSLTM